MSGTPQVTATIVFHHEGSLAIPALASMRDLVDTALAAGLRVETTAMLAQVDDLTRHVVRTRGTWLCNVSEPATGDFGLARNAATLSARGEFLAFLDGDGLWGSDWIRLAYAAATAVASPAEAIWHPALLYYCAETDFDRHSINAIPDPLARSAFATQHVRDGASSDKNTLLFDNLWSGNTFTHRRIHLRVPYSATEPRQGFGEEDWRWNIATLWHGISHRVVPDTVHLIRVKDTVDGVLPRLPDDVWPHQE